jgi:hypothetical protein
VMRGQRVFEFHGFLRFTAYADRDGKSH